MKSLGIAIFLSLSLVFVSRLHASVAFRFGVITIIPDKMLGAKSLQESHVTVESKSLQESHVSVEKRDKRGY